MSVGSTSSSTETQNQTTSTGYDAYSDMDMEDFISLLITEMQSQDPLDPMDNTEVMQQLTQIQAIEANNRLNDTLDAVQLGQAMSTASSLIGKEIEALTDDAEYVTGTVDRVTVVDGVPKLHIGDYEATLTNVSAIMAADTE